MNEELLEELDYVADHEDECIVDELEGYVNLTRDVFFEN